MDGLNLWAIINILKFMKEKKKRKKEQEHEEKGVFKNIFWIDKINQN